MPITYPAAVVRNKTTGLFHVVQFRPSPKPHEQDDKCSFHSQGFLETGYDSIDDARLSIETNTCCPTKDTEKFYEWSGEGKPILVDTFSRSLYGFPIHP